MTFQVSITGHSKDIGALPYDQEIALVKKHTAILRAMLEDMGCTVSSCTVNAETVLAAEADMELEPMAPSPESLAKHPTTSNEGDE